MIATQGSIVQRGDWMEVCSWVKAVRCWGLQGVLSRPVPVWKGPFSGLRKCSKKHILALPVRGLVPSLARSCLSFASSARDFPPKFTAQAVFLPAAQPWASLRQLQPWQNGWQSPGGSQTSLELLP